MLTKLAPAFAITASLGLAAPAFAQDVPEEISSAVEAAETAGVIETLTSGEPVTVFVPTNDAIAAAPEDALAEVTGDPEALASLIQGYAVSGTVMASDAISMAQDAGGETTVDTLGGSTLTISSDGEQVMVGTGDTMATVVTPDLTLGNVTIHVIDTAFLPASGM